MGCLQISFPSTQRSLGFGGGGAGGGSSFLPFSQSTEPSGLQVVAQFGMPLSTAAGPRTFVISGIDQATIASGTVMLPTSDDVSLDGVYAFGSSQFYTVGEVHWNGTKRVQGTEWQLVQPFHHIVEVLVNPATITGPVTLIYYAWDIGVRADFQVTAYPVAFSFVGTRILADQAPRANLFFTVHYKQARRGRNPTTMFARHPTIVDDLLEDHTLYDGASGFETYRPEGYRVYNFSTNQLYRWDGTQWLSAGIFVSGTKFYVKRLHSVFQFDGSEVNLIYTAGDALTLAVPEALSYPVDPLPSELFGESIGKNLIPDGFSGSASILYPSAYMISQRPGDYDDWIAQEFG